MAGPKRVRQPVFSGEDDHGGSTSAFIQSILAPTTSSSRGSASDDLQFQRKHDTAKVLRDQSGMTPKKYSDANSSKTTADQSKDTIEDDWVCPVAVALRRAGYDVPLRPSKSWLERDRKKQACSRRQ